VSPRGYCDRNFFVGCASGLYFWGAERDECCDETPLEGVFEFELGLDPWSVSIIGGFGDRDGLECRDMAEGDLEDGNEDKEVLRFGATLPLELRVPAVSVVAVVPLVVGRCIAPMVTLFLVYMGGWAKEEAIFPCSKTSRKAPCLRRLHLNRVQTSISSGSVHSRRAATRKERGQ
jgi:hypothetical protein